MKMKRTYDSYSTVHQFTNSPTSSKQRYILFYIPPAKIDIFVRISNDLSLVNPQNPLAS